MDIKELTLFMWKQRRINVGAIIKSIVTITYYIALLILIPEDTHLTQLWWLSSTYRAATIIADFTGWLCLGIQDFQNHLKKD